MKQIGWEISNRDIWVNLVGDAQPLEGRCIRCNRCNDRVQRIEIIEENLFTPYAVCRLTPGCNTARKCNSRNAQLFLLVALPFGHKTSKRRGIHPTAMGRGGGAND